MHLYRDNQANTNPLFAVCSGTGIWMTLFSFILMKTATDQWINRVRWVSGNISFFSFFLFLNKRSWNNKVTLHHFSGPREHGVPHLDSSETEGGPALTPAHLELTRSETQRRCINNTLTCVQCVFHQRYTNADRKRANMLHRLHTCARMYIYLCKVCQNLCVHNRRALLFHV